MADYQTIVDALDAAILAWAAEPVTLSQAGKSVTYRSLAELINARKYYASLAQAVKNKRPFTITHLKAGGPR